MEEENVKLLSPKIDVVFQALFGEVGNETITKDFIEAIIERKIEEVDLSKNIVLRRKNLEDKMGVLDVIAKIDDKEYVNIEIQSHRKNTILLGKTIYKKHKKRRRLHKFE